MQAEQAMRQSEARFRSLIQNSADIIMVVDPDGLVRYGSPAVELTLGYRVKDLTGCRSAPTHLGPQP